MLEDASGNPLPEKIRVLCGRWAWKREEIAASCGWRRLQKELREQELGD